MSDFDFLTTVPQLSATKNGIKVRIYFNNNAYEREFQFNDFETYGFLKPMNWRSFFTKVFKHDNLKLFTEYNKFVMYSFINEGNNVFLKIYALNEILNDNPKPYTYLFKQITLPESGYDYFGLSK